MKRILLLVVLCAFTFSIFAAPVWDNPTCVRKGVNLDWNGSCADTQDGNVIYVWSDISSGTRDIYAQKYNQEGTPIWPQPIVIDNHDGLQEYPQILKTTSDVYVISYYDYSTENMGIIKAQAINQNGVMLWGPGGKTICNEASYKLKVKMIAGTNGTCFIIWEDHRNSNADIYGQNMNYSGNIQWIANGKQLTFMPAMEFDPNVISDNNNGFILGYRYYNTGHEFSYLNRYNSNGDMAWGAPMQLHLGLNNVFLNSIIPYNSNSFVCLWDYADSFTSNLAAQRIDMDGNMIWAEPSVIIPENTYSNLGNAQCIKTTEGNIIVTWETMIDSPSYQGLSSQKLSPDGILTWDSNGISVFLGEGGVQSYQLINGSSGGANIVWQSNNENELRGHDLNLQNLSSSGERLLGDNGTCVCNYSCKDASVSLKMNNNLLRVTWDDNRNGNMGIYTQRYDSSGSTLLPSNGISLISVLGNDIELQSIKTIRRLNDNIVFWVDYRWNRRGALYYQIINDDGSCLLENDGRLLTMGNIGSPNDFSAVLGDNAEVAIIWQEYGEVSTYLYGQLIDAMGNKLWTENGMIISGTASPDHRYSDISYDNGSFYVGWLMYNINTSGSTICGQKITNGELQWDPNGVFISLHNQDCWVMDFELSGRYFVWTQFSSTGAFVMVKLVTFEGQTADGWQEYGNRVDNTQDDFIEQSNPMVQSNGLGVFISWNDMRWEYMQKIFAQHITPQGELAWGDNALVVYELPAPLFGQFLNNDSITYMWTAYMNPDQILSSKFSLNGDNVWTELSLLGPVSDLSYQAPQSCQFANDGYMVATIQEDNYTRKLQYRYVDALGNPVGALQGQTLSNPLLKSSNPSVSADQTNAYIGWGEYSMHKMYGGGQNEDNYFDLTGLFFQKLNNETVANEDPTTPSINVTLEQNYPNPFNPETSIQYALPSQSDVKLNIYNIKGQKVKTLVQEKQAAGDFTVKWNGKDDSDNQIASGIYFYRLETEMNTLTKKMVLLK